MRSIVIICLGLLLITLSVSCSDINSSTDNQRTFILSDTFTFNNDSPVSSISIYKSGELDTNQSAYVFEIKPEAKIIDSDTNINYSSFKIMLEPDLEPETSFAKVALNLSTDWIEENKLASTDLEILLVSEKTISEIVRVEFVEVKEGYHHYTAKIAKSGDYLIRSKSATTLNENSLKKALLPINSSERNTSSFSTLPRIITNRPSGPNAVSKKDAVEYASALFKSGNILDSKIKVKKDSIVEARVKVNTYQEVSGELMVEITKDYINQEDTVIRTCKYNISLQSGENTVGNCLFKIDESTSDKLIQYSLRVLWENNLIYEAPEINPIEHIITQN